MGRTLSRSRKRSTQKFIACPGAATWELWGLPMIGQAHLVEKAEELALLPVSNSCLLALPVQHVFAIPLWLLSADTAVFGEMIFAQLEKRGLASRSQSETVFQYDVLMSEPNQTLVLVAVLPSLLPEQFCQTDVGSFDISARLYPLPPNQFIIWHENDRLVLAATKDSKLAYFQTLNDKELATPVFHELSCIRLELEAQKIVMPQGITVWGDFAEAEIDLLKMHLALPVQSQPRPAPRLPSKSWDLTPRLVVVAQDHQLQRQKRMQIFYAIGAVYLAYVLWALLQVGWLRLQTWNIQKSITKDAPLVKTMKETALRWKALELAINPKSYSIEQLLAISHALPAEGVRLTSFTQVGHSLSIKGQAKTPDAVTAFEDKLKASKEMRVDRWEMPAPRLLQTGEWQFTIEGGLAHATAN